MKDYKLIRFLAIKSGARVNKSKDMLNCYFGYTSDACVVMTVGFVKGQSHEVLFDISEVYDAYGKRKYSSLEEFVDAFVKENSFFKKFKSEKRIYVSSDLTVNTVKHCVSPALANLTVLFTCLNDMLGRDEPVNTEEDWRDIHRTMLLNSQRQSKRIRTIAIVALVAAIAYMVLVVSQNGADGFLAFLAYLSILIIIASPIVIIFFTLRAKYYKKQLEKSLKAKPLEFD